MFLATRHQPAGPLRVSAATLDLMMARPALERQADLPRSAAQVDDLVLRLDVRRLEPFRPAGTGHAVFGHIPRCHQCMLCTTM